MNGVILSILGSGECVIVMHEMTHQEKRFGNCENMRPNKSSSLKNASALKVFRVQMDTQMTRVKKIDRCKLLYFALLMISVFHPLEKFTHRLSVNIYGE